MHLSPSVLCDSRRKWRERIEPFRAARTCMIREFAGSWYGHANKTAESAKPLPLIANAVRTFVARMVAKNPKCECRSRSSANRSFAKLHALAVDHVSREFDMRRLVRETVFSAQFGTTLVKTAVSEPGRRQRMAGFSGDYGLPYCELVSFDDLIGDPQARVWDEMAYVGHQLRIPKLWAWQTGLVKDAKLLSAMVDWDQREGAIGAADRISSGRRVAGDSADELVEYITVDELYFPDDQVIALVPGGGFDFGGVHAPALSREAFWLDVQDYIGPDGGPYSRLELIPVTDNLFSAAPVGYLMDLAIAANMLQTKVARRGKRSKSVLAYEGNAKDDAENIRTAGDGESVQVNNINAIRMFDFDQNSDRTYEHLGWLIQRFSDAGLGMEQMQGVRERSKTATQAQILDNATQTLLGDAMEEVYGLVGELQRKLGWYIRQDPNFKLRLSQKIKDQTLEWNYKNELNASREDDAWEMEYQCVPYSMQRMDPVQRSVRLQEWARQTVIPVLGFAIQTGYDPTPLLRATADGLDITEIDEIWPDPRIGQETAQVTEAAKAMIDGHRADNTGGGPPAPRTMLGVRQAGRFPGGPPDASVSVPAA